MKNKTVTVLYYSEPTSIEVKVKTFKNLPYEAQNKRVKLPDDFKANKLLSDKRHLLPDAVLLRTVRATFTAYGSSLHKSFNVTQQL
ncbi:hypothetical protein JQC92_21670, partial [Shewanella sp. 202IG2-18]|uniref:DUF2375 family protein n=1 Tax=Parashewanella hymeniacidonis TaxID=2807618 RepID=UPI001960B010